MEYSIEQIESMRSAARRCSFDLPQSFFIAPSSVLEECFNGTGAEWMSDKIRESLDDVMDDLLPVVLGHDYEFSNSDGTFKSFVRANNNLLVNGFKYIKMRYSWRNKEYWLKSLLVIGAYRRCMMYGWIAWRQAFKELQKQDGKEVVK